jgi:hypothetical protein
MAMPDKRQPLAVMIAMHAKKPDAKSGDDAGGMADDDDDGAKPEHDDEGLIQACQDVIDAIATKDAHALNKALVSWQDLYESSHEDDEAA